MQEPPGEEEPHSGRRGAAPATPPPNPPTCRAPGLSPPPPPALQRRRHSASPARCRASAALLGGHRPAQRPSSALRRTGAGLRGRPYQAALPSEALECRGVHQPAGLSRCLRPAQRQAVPQPERSRRLYRRAHHVRRQGCTRGGGRGWLRPLGRRRRVGRSACGRRRCRSRSAGRAAPRRSPPPRAAASPERWPPAALLPAARLQDRLAKQIDLQEC